MTHDGALVWESDNPFGWAPGAIFGTLVGLVIAFVGGLALSVPFGWCALTVVLCATVGGGFGYVVSRRSIMRVIFEGENAYLVSKTARRQVSLSDLRDVSVHHYGDSNAGYTQTQLTVRWRSTASGRVRRVELPNAHDPALAHRLVEILGPRTHVEEHWQELRAPAQGPSGGP